MRLIDADALIEDLEAAKANNGMGGMVASALIRYVKRCSTIDAVPVVRCKECEHRTDKMYIGHYMCKRKMDGMVDPYDFCSYGERRSDD